MSNRITGPTSPEPEKNQAIHSQAERDRAKRVEKVEKIDPDEQARNRRKERFRMMMEESDDAATPAPSKTPSPFDLFSSGPPKKSLGDIQNSAVPSPQSSPPPSLQPSAGNKEGESEEEDLPHSGEFWHQINLPDEPPPSKLAMKPEKDAEKSSHKKAPLPSIKEPEIKTSKHAKSQSKSPSSMPFKEDKIEHEPKQPPSVKQTSPRPAKLNQISQKEEDQGKTPSARYWEPEQKIERSHLPAAPERKEDHPSKLGKKASSKHTIKEKEDEVESQLEPRSTPSRPFPEPLESSLSKKHSKDKIESLARSLPPIPQLSPDLHTAAVQAAFEAQPYLSPEVLPLFFQLAGSILVMTTRSGSNQTEVRLVGSAFEKSKFYGSTIEITKFSTAPNSINIRLTGSNEAVTAFNQNLPQLRAAFENGNFNFRIGRLAAEYEVSRPASTKKEKRKGLRIEEETDEGAR